MRATVPILATLAASIVAPLLAASPSLAQGPSPNPPAAQAAPLQAVAATVLVHVDAPEAVTLEISDGDGGWQKLCTSPCDRAVPAIGSYRIAGEGIRNSTPFRLEAGARTTLAIEPTSSGAHAGAVVLTVVGGIALVPVAGVTAVLAIGEAVGAILICPLAAAFETVKSQQGAEYVNCLSGVASFFAPAYAQPWVWVPGVVGGVALTGGIVGLVLTPHTGVLVSTPAPTAVFSPAPLTSDGIRVPRPVVYPVVELSF